MAATPTTPATLATFLNARGFVCSAQDVAPTVGGVVGPFVIGKDHGNRQFAIAWGTVALPIVKAGVDALANGGMNIVCMRYTAAELIMMKGDANCVYPLATTTPGALIATDDAGLMADLLFLLDYVAPPMVG